MNILGFFFNLIAVRRTVCSTRNVLNIFLVIYKSSTIIETNRLDFGLRKAESLSVLRLISLSSYGRLQTLTTVVITLMDLDLLLNLDLA